MTEGWFIQEDRALSRSVVLLKKALAGLLVVSILFSGLCLENILAASEGVKTTEEALLSGSTTLSQNSTASDGSASSEDGVYPVGDIPQGAIAFDLKYSYGTIHVIHGEDDYRIFQSASLSENYFIEDGEMGAPVEMTGSHVLVLEEPVGTIQVDAFDSWGYELDVKAFSRTGQEVAITRNEGFYSIPSDGSIVCVAAGSVYATAEEIAYATYGTSGDDMTPDNNIVLAFAKAVGFDVDSFIEHNGWTVFGGKYDGYYDTAQGKADMSGSVPFTDGGDIGSIWPDYVWQGINKWVGASTWEQMNEHVHHGANPGTQCAGLVALFFGYIYKTDFYKDPDWKAYYDAFSYGTYYNLSGTFSNFNGVGMIEAGHAGLNYFKGKNGYYVKECNNRTMTHDDFVAMLDQMGPGAVIRFSNNIDNISDGGHKFAYQHSAVYIGKANGLHWIFHSNAYEKKARISPLEFFVNCFIQGSQDPDKSTYYLARAGGMLVVPDEPNCTVQVTDTANADPIEVAVTQDKNAVFSVERKGSVKSCRWQVSKDGGTTWKNVNAASYPTAVTAILTFKAATRLNGYLYRCKVTYSDGTTGTSETIKLLVNKIKSPPKDTTVAAGDTATFTVSARGEPTGYCWQVSKNGGSTWKNVSVGKYPSAATKTLSFKTKATFDGFQYRCIVTFSDGGSLTSEVGNLSVIAGAILSDPVSVTVTAPDSAAFSVSTQGSVVTYQWQVSKNGGSTWKYINAEIYPSAATAELAFTTKLTMNGYLYRCRVKFADGTALYSGTALLTVNGILTQPEDASAAAGEEVSFSINAVGQAKQYIWQVSMDGGETWKNISKTTYPSSRTATLTFTAKADWDGFIYRCEVTFTNGTVVVSDTAKLSIN